VRRILGTPTAKDKRARPRGAPRHRAVRSIPEIENDWFDCRLESDPSFLARVRAAGMSLGQGKGTNEEDLLG
jgi:hypothetical protein